MIMRTRISLSFGIFTKSERQTSAAFKSSTSVSSARSMVSTSEKPKRPQILPPTVAQLRNCTPTIWRRLSYGTFRICMKSPMKFQVLQWVIQPITNSLSVSVMVSRPSPERSMAVVTTRLPIFSHTMPPSTQAVRFWFSS